MDNKQKGSAAVVSSALAIFVMAVLVFGGLAVTTQTPAFAQGTGKEAGAATSEPAKEEAAPEPSVLPAPPEEGGVSGGEEGRDLNCGDIQERNFAVDPATDVNGFDGDNDGLGCENEAVAGEELTEVEIIITGEFVDEQVAENPELEVTIEEETAPIVENLTADPGFVEEVQGQIDEVVAVIAENNSQVAEAIPAEVNVTGVAEEVVEIIVVDTALETEGVDVTAVGNASQALENVDITAEEVTAAVDVVEANASAVVTEEVTPEEAPVAVAEPGKEGTVTEEPATAVEVETPTIVDVAVEEELEESEEEVAAAAGIDQATLRQLLERALEIVG